MKPTPAIKSCRVLIVSAFLTLAATASANGAMGLALEIFDVKIWWVYVVATVAFEAWFVGYYLKHGWLRSAKISLGVNLLTSFCCAGGFFSVFLHPNAIEVNPLLWTFEVLLVYGLLSAVVEAIFWARSNPDVSQWKTFGRTVLAHLLGVPLAMAILLIPARPYTGLERLANTWRFIDLNRDLKQAYVNHGTDDTGHFKQFANRQELETSLDAIKPGGSVELYNAAYGRFDTHDNRSEPLPIELNQKISDDNPWVVRVHFLNGTREYYADGSFGHGKLLGPDKP